MEKRKTVLITGAKGFLGKNLVCELLNRYKDTLSILEYDLDNSPRELEEYLQAADFVFHLAGVNRPQTEEEFAAGNTGLTERLLFSLTAQGRATPFLLSSSIQAERDNAYGLSKKGAEDAAFAYGKETGAPVFVYRLPNLFGKWCRPNYNSAVATFCHNIARGLPVTVTDPSILMRLCYIDDVVNAFISAMEGCVTPGTDGFCQVQPVHKVTLSQIVDTLSFFRESRQSLLVPDMDDAFVKKLYSTYLSHLPEAEFSYPLKMNTDHRGSFTEFLKTAGQGQVSVNISKPHITKGNHWHHTKNEKFLVVSGQGVIRFRKIGEEKIIEYAVSGEKLEVVDIPVGYTHNIENTGDSDMVTIMWANESFDPQHPDTYFLEV